MIQFLFPDASPSPKSERKKVSPPPQKPKQQTLFVKTGKKNNPAEGSREVMNINLRNAPWSCFQVIQFLFPDALPSPKSERKQMNPPLQKPKQQQLPTSPLLPPGPVPSDNGDVSNAIFTASKTHRGYGLC